MLQMVGCNHRHSSVALRERLAFTDHQVQSALGTLRTRFPQSEAVVLSTCNRVEIYTAAEGPKRGPSHEQVANFLAEFHGLDLAEIFDDLIEHSGENVVRHLFMVAASLDSMVVGEPQILAQVKSAYRMASTHDSTGPLTHAVFQRALSVAARVNRETAINEKRVSIPSVAIGDFAMRIFERLDDKRVLVIGAGEMAQETLRYLREEGAREIVVVTRNYQRGESLAREFSGRAGPWEELSDQLIAADVVISTTGASEPVVTLDAYMKIEGQRYQRPLFVLDLAIPRDFAPEIADRLGVYLYSIDDLKEACRENRRARDKELPAAIHIVEQETDRFMADLNHRATGPIIQRLRQGWQRPKEDELRRLFNKLPELDDRSRAEIERAFDRLVNKLLHPPLESLRDEARQGTSQALIEALKRLFQIKE